MRPSSLPTRTLCGLALLTSVVSGQVSEAWMADPYTKGDEAAMKTAGYVRFGPLTWGDDHDTRAIDKMLSHAEIIWIETRHFKLGCHLAPYQLPRRGKWKKKIVDELKELQKKLPAVNPKTKVLDPWLRAHLYAHRLEVFYADFCKRLGVEDEDFPKKGKPSRLGRYMGKGPHLGMPGKFCILLLTKASDVIRYGKRAGRPVDANKRQPVKAYFVKQGSLCFATMTEAAGNALAVDKSMHCHLYFNLVHSLLDGYKHYAHGLPKWFCEGLAHWYVHRIDPKENQFSGMKGGIPKEHKDPKWKAKLRKRIKHKDYEPLSNLMKHMGFNQFSFGDHMAIWSRVEYLLANEPEKFAKFLGRMKAPVSAASGKSPTDEAVLKRQDECFREAFGMDPKAFDKVWVRYVLKKYPRK